MIKRDLKWRTEINNRYLRHSKKYQRYFEFVFDVEVQHCSKEFVGYYGSQPAYSMEVDFEEDYDYRIDCDYIFENYFENKEYFKGLKERNPELYKKVWYEEYDEFNYEYFYEPDDDNLKVVWKDLDTLFKDFVENVDDDSYNELATNIQENAQEEYSNGGANTTGLACNY